MTKRTLRSFWVMFVLFLSIFAAGCATKEEKEARHHKKAKEYIEKEELNKAVIELRNVVQLNPKNDVAYYELGETYLKLNQREKAFYSFSRAASLDKNNLQAQLKTGQMLLLGKKTEEAREKAELVLKKSPENINALHLLSGIHIQEKDIDAALKTLEKCSAIDPDNFKTHISMGRIFLLKKNLDRAEKAYRKAKSIDSSSSIPYLSLANIYNLEKKWPQAELELKEMINISGSDYKNLLELARFYENQKEWEKAEEIYVEATGLASEKDVIPLIRLGNFYSRRESFDQAIDTMQKAASLKKENLDILLGIAQIYLQGKQIEQADNTLDKILEKDKGHVKANFLKGRIYLIKKDFDNALPLFDLTVREKTDSAIAHYFKALCLLGKGENHLAQENLLKAVELDSRLLDARLILADAYLRQRNKLLARQQIDATLKLDPNNIKALMLKGNLEILNKNFNDAEAIFMQVVKKLPDYAPGYVKLGFVYTLIGTQEKALENLKKALELDPKQTNALALAVRLYNKSGEYEKADLICEELKKGVHESPFSLAQIEYIQGNISLAQKDTKAAHRHFEQAVKTDANILAAYVALAKLYIKENQGEKAISQYNSLLEKDPKSLVALMGLGTIYDQRGDSKKAEASYRNALKIKDNFAPAANNLAWNLLKSGGNIDEALGYARIAKEQMPQNSSVMDTLGWLYYLKGSYLNAIAELQDSLAQEPNNPVINYHMGMAYFKNGQKDAAKQFLEKALNISQDFEEAEEAHRILSEINSPTAS